MLTTPAFEGSQQTAISVEADRRRSPTWPEWAVLFCYAALLALAVPYHEPFADEAQAWQIATHVSVWNLFAHAVRYEGSPGLWYLWLRSLHALHANYIGMHWATALVGAVSAGILIFKAPFSRPVRFALPFTFFLAYQYPVIARSYVLVPPLLYGVAITWRRRSPMLIALLLGLLANVAGHAFFISLGFAAVYAFEISRKEREPPIKDLVPGVLLLVVLYAIAVASVWPVPQDSPFAPTLAPAMLMKSASKIPLFGLVQVLLATSSWPALSILLGAAFLYAILRLGCWVYLAPIAGLILFCGYRSALRHGGLAIPTAIAICWILAQKGLSASRSLLAILSVWIILHLAWTGRAIVYDHYHPYSPDRATAQYLAPYIQSGGRVAASFLNEPQTDAFWAVGLEPYFSERILADQKLPFWLFSRNYHPEGEFVRAISTRPSFVLLEYHSWLSFDPTRDLRGPHVDLLRHEGYRYSRVFCGEQIEGWSARVTLCHVIFEKPPTLS